MIGDKNAEVKLWSTQFGRTVHRIQKNKSTAEKYK